MCCDGIRKPQAEIDRIALDAYRHIISRLYDVQRDLSDHLTEPEKCFPRRLSEKQLSAAYEAVSKAIRALDGDLRVKHDGWPGMILWCDSNPSTELINDPSPSPAG